MALLNSIAGGGGLIKLAPNLTYPGDLSAGSSITQISLNPSTGLITALSLTGKFAIDTLSFTTMIAETVTVKLTIDGVVIWNDTFTSGTSVQPLVQGNAAYGPSPIITCDSSFLLEMQTATDTAVTFTYRARPIL